MTQCVRLAVQQPRSGGRRAGGAAAVALHGYDERTGTSECSLRATPWSTSESSAAGEAEHHACVVPAGGGGLPLGGPSDAYALYNVRQPEEKRGSGKPRPSQPRWSETLCGVSGMCGVRFRPPVVGGGDSSCATSVLPIDNACFTESTTSHSDPGIEVQAHWETHRARLVQPGVLALAAGGRVAQRLRLDAVLAGEFRVTVTMQRSRLDFSVVQTLRAHVVVMAAAAAEAPTTTTSSGSSSTPPRSSRISESYRFTI